MADEDRGRSVAHSYALYQEALGIIPGGTQLISRRPQLYAPGLTPPYVARGKGAYFWDLDGNQYLDLMMCVGAAILGYADDAVDTAVIDQIRSGTAYSISHPLEVELARELIATIPCAEAVRYCKGGGEANTIAVRIARAATGRERVLFCGYHGWHDWYLAANLESDEVLDAHLLPGIRPQGIPHGLAGTALPFRYNDLASLEAQLERHRGSIACIIMEPARGAALPAPGFLEGVRELATAHGVLLIFDEVVTGFRLALGGAQERFGVIPDMATYAKAISNGYAMGAVVGSHAAMDIAGELFISSTYWSDAVGLAASLATIRELRRRDAITAIGAFGSRLQQMFNGLAAEYRIPLAAVGLPQLIGISYTDIAPELKRPLKDYYVQELTRRGIFSSLGVNPSLAHGDAELTRIEQVLHEIFPLLAAVLRDGDWDARLVARSVDAFRRQVG
ncbi:MAG TPA: aminotransferase class III-fold pyridoxal phosphate-dependent enzyme [Roseiflexaceae bacterium]|nr:aminotransferase class III-fold pyridoxal phosphate-dependent enzyme [Roseiflexaceae bacterium]